MAARWEERQDGRDTGRADTTASTPPSAPGGIGCPLELGAALLVFAVAYAVVHGLVWLGRSASLAGIGVAVAVVVGGALVGVYARGRRQVARIVDEELAAREGPER